MSNPLHSPVKLAIIALVVVLLVLSWISLKPEPGTPEVVVEDTVRELVAAAEARNLKPFRHHLSENVKDGADNSKKEILRLLQAIFLRNNTISLTILGLTVEKDSNPEILHVTLVLLMGNTPIPEDKGTFEFTFRREGDWKVWEMKWQDGVQYGI